uniref:Major sperm protein n=1 Tax=Panagrolaimus davidi TaxID=227884 RepID=A0A914Q614_9BILA
MSTGMEEFIESPMLLLQCGIAIAVPAVLTAIVNLGCGKKREPPPRPGGAAAAGKKNNLAKTKPGAAGASSTKSAKSKRSTKSAASKSGKKGKAGISTKEGKSKRSSKSIDKSGKSGKKSKKSSKGSKSSKSKKSKREVGKQEKSGPLSSLRSDAAKQASSARTAIEAEARSAKEAAKDAGKALENSVKSAATQVSSSQRSTQPGSDAILDGNANAVGTTSLVAIGAGEQNRDLKMEPAELRWSSAGGMQKISLLNQSNERQAVKVKCSDNNVYRVNPVYAIVEPGQTLSVDVMRQNGSNKVDKIVFVTTRAGLEENPKNLFKPGTQSSMMVLPLLATTTTAAAINQPALTAAN